MTDDPDKRLRIELDHEHKIIRLDYFFHELKGVMICESTEEERRQFYCGRFMTYPIVDENWVVRQDSCIADGIENLIIGKMGDTLPLVALREALDLSAELHGRSYADILLNIEGKGITITNRNPDNPEEELSDTIVLCIDKVRENEHIYRIEAHWDSYYIPVRFCYVGEDHELYHWFYGLDGTSHYSTFKIVDLIVRDVQMLSWFFRKPNLKVLATAYEVCDGYHPDVLFDIPKDWYYTIQTLDRDINRKLDPRIIDYYDFQYRGYSRSHWDESNQGNKVFW